MFFVIYSKDRMFGFVEVIGDFLKLYRNWNGI